MSGETIAAGLARGLGTAALSLLALVVATLSEARANAATETVQTFLTQLWPAARARGVSAET
ncbi:hypothetical protein EGT07_32895, partial [Herbaspirillum sp. HC18]